MSPPDTGGAVNEDEDHATEGPGDAEDADAAAFVEEEEGGDEFGDDSSVERPFGELFGVEKWCRRWVVVVFAAVVLRHFNVFCHGCGISRLDRWLRKPWSGDTCRQRGEATFKILVFANGTLYDCVQLTYDQSNAHCVDDLGEALEQRRSVDSAPGWTTIEERELKALGRRLSVQIMKYNEPPTQGQAGGRGPSQKGKYMSCAWFLVDVDIPIPPSSTSYLAAQSHPSSPIHYFYMMHPSALVQSLTMKRSFDNRWVYLVDCLYMHPLIFSGHQSNSSNIATRPNITSDRTSHLQSQKQKFYAIDYNENIMDTTPPILHFIRLVAPYEPPDDVPASMGIVESDSAYSSRKTPNLRGNYEWIEWILVVCTEFGKIEEAEEI
ncbi:hypothetical protein LXL04_013039 [Taraxacum kok-saghyz]